MSPNTASNRDRCVAVIFSKGLGVMAVCRIAETAECRARLSCVRLTNFPSNYAFPSARINISNKIVCGQKKFDKLNSCL